MTQQKNSEFETEPNVRLSPRYFEAVAYASGLHAGQTRKGTTIPYVTHLLGVSSLVLEALGDEDQAIAALLHDAAEDCGGEPRLVEIEEMFGPRVASIVRGCSDSLVQDPTVKAPWRERKEEYIAHLQGVSPDLILVSCADKLHNARSLWTDIQREGAQTMERFNATGPEIAWYHTSLLDAFASRSAPADLLIPLREVTENLSMALNPR
jgi:(p)ppGpp synthase/HD superfamily hydrolase